jgi:hypothetical protein
MERATVEETGLIANQIARVMRVGIVTQPLRSSHLSVGGHSASTVTAVGACAHSPRTDR